MEDRLNLYNKDCLEVFKELKDDSVNLIVTDPPYRITGRGNSGNSGGMCKKNSFNAGTIFEHNDIEVSEYAPEFFRVLKDGSHCYVMCNHVNLQSMLNNFTDIGFHFIKSLIWDKGNKIMGTYYMSQFEYILFFRKGQGVPINDCGTSDILSIPNIKMKRNDGTNFHDTEKPVALWDVLISNSSKENELVLDPFMGIGGSAVSAKKLNRRFIGCEIDTMYYEVAVSRVNNSVLPDKGFKPKRLF